MNAQRDDPDDIAALLRQADAAAPPPPGGVELAPKVRRLSRRRALCRDVVKATSAAAVLVVLASSAYLVRPPSRPTTATPPVATLAEYRLAKAEADARVAFVVRIVTSEKLDRPRATRDSDSEQVDPLPLDQVALLRAQAALALVGQADQLTRRADRPGEALATYRRAAELFPETPGAAVARRRMEDLQTQLRNQETPV